jgi:hypothetical protein
MDVYFYYAIAISAFVSGGFCGWQRVGVPDPRRIRAVSDSRVQKFVAHVAKMPAASGSTICATCCILVGAAWLKFKLEPRHAPSVVAVYFAELMIFVALGYIVGLQLDPKA